MRLSLRLTIVFTTLGLALIAGSSGLAWYLSATEIRESVDADLIERARLLESISRNEIGDAARTRVDDIEQPVGAVLGSQESGVQFFDGSLEPVGTNVIPLSESTRARIIAGETATIESIVDDGVHYRVLTSTISAPVELPGAFDGLATIQLYRDTTSEEAAIASLAVRLLVMSGLGVVAVAITSWFVGRWLAEPLDRLTTAAGRLASLDDAPARIEISRTDEIGRLAESFNRMLSALEVGREQQRRLVADASHELRTPLTSLRMRAEFLATQATTDDLQAQVIAGAVVDVEQLTALVTDLIDLAADVRSSDEQPRMTELGDVATEVAERTAIATGRRIEVAADGSRAAVRPTMITRAIQNLVDNAIKYGPRAGVVTIVVERGRIEVVDEGPGIGPEDADHVFDRFYRSPKARTRPGNGIGLAIVKQVADAHNGDTWIRTPPAGTGAVVGFSIGPVADIGRTEERPVGTMG